MPISRAEQQVSDFDWFATDRYGLIAHFATGGRGAIPAPMMATVDELKSRAHLVRDLLAPRTTALINPLIDSQHGFANDAAKQRYLVSFLQFARRGLFSYDCRLAERWPGGYSLVAAPEAPMVLTECSPELQAALNPIVFHEFSFKLVVAIDAQVILGTEKRDRFD